MLQLTKNEKIKKGEFLSETVSIVTLTHTPRAKPPLYQIYAAPGSWEGNKK